MSPDGSRLAWVRAGSDRRAHVFVSRLDGSAAQQVTSGVADDSEPAWSPDGTTLALTRRSAVTGRTTALVGADGTQGRVIARGVGHPSWSPDGRFLAVETDKGDVAVMDAAGRHQTVVAAGRRGPAWSPDGAALALRARQQDCSAWEVLDLATQQRRTLLVRQPDSVYCGTPAWRPDGRSLFIGAARDGPGLPDFGTVLEVPREGTDQPRNVLPNASDPAAGGGTRAAPVTTSVGPVTGLVATAEPSAVRLRYALPPGTAGVTIRYAAGDVPPDAVTAGLDGGDAYGQVAVIDRLAPSTTYSFAVFTRTWRGGASAPVTVTTRTPPQVASSLTLLTPTSQTTYRSPVVLTGRLVRGDTGRGVGGAVLRLLGTRTGQPAQRLGLLRTDPNGSFRTTHRPDAGTRYTVVWDGSDPVLPATATAVVQVARRLDLRLSASRVRRGEPLTVTLSVAPTDPTVIVTLYWTTGHRRLPDAAGRVVLTLNTRRAPVGTSSLTAVADGRGGLLRGYATAQVHVSR